MFLRVRKICENQLKKDLNVKPRTTFDCSIRFARVIRNVFNFIVDKFVYVLFPLVPKLVKPNMPVILFSKCTYGVRIILFAP